MHSEQEKRDAEAFKRYCIGMGYDLNVDDAHDAWNAALAYAANQQKCSGADIALVRKALEEIKNEINRQFAQVDSEFDGEPVCCATVLLAEEYLEAALQPPKPIGGENA